jgi:putrescine transport system permease protein
MATDANKPPASWRARTLVVLPYLWLAIFFLAPFVIAFKISLSQTVLAQPPYLPVLDPAAGSESGRIGNLNPQSKLKKK